MKKGEFILKDYELEKYFRNHKYCIDVKVEIDGKIYDIDEIKWMGIYNENPHIIKIKIKS